MLCKKKARFVGETKYNLVLQQKVVGESHYTIFVVNSILSYYTEKTIVMNTPLLG